MANFNKVILAGNLVRDNEIRYVQGDTLAVLRNAIAVNRRYKEKEETMFIDVVFFGKQAETMKEYTAKGSQLLVEGRLNQNVWESEGVKRTKHEVIVENFQFLGGRKDGGQQSAAPEADTTGRFTAPSDAPDDDMPF
jgi:single-strand DNA-binding protein